LNDTVLINLRNSSTGRLIGRIWLFDLTSLSYSISSSVGTYSVIAENGAVISYDARGYSYVREGLDVYEDSNVLSMRMTQLVPSRTAYTAVSGGGVYRVYARLIENVVREDTSVYMLKVQVHGDVKDAWLDYFSSYYNFPETIYADNTLMYDISSTTSFVLSQSTIKIGIEGVG